MPYSVQMYCTSQRETVDFVRGAKRSNGGKSILVLKSTAKKGTISSIVPQLPQGAIDIAGVGDLQIPQLHGLQHLIGAAQHHVGVDLNVISAVGRSLEQLLQYKASKSEKNIKQEDQSHEEGKKI